MALSLSALQEQLLKVYPFLKEHNERITKRCTKYQAAPDYSAAVSMRFMLVSDVIDNKIGKPVQEKVQMAFEQGAVAFIDLQNMMFSLNGRNKVQIKQHMDALRDFYAESGFVEEHPRHPGYPVHPQPVLPRLLEVV